MQLGRQNHKEGISIKILIKIPIHDHITFLVYRVYNKKRNLGISQEIDIVLKTKDFRRMGI
jgi:hypothetical protein